MKSQVPKYTGVRRKVPAAEDSCFDGAHGNGFMEGRSAMT